MIPTKELCAILDEMGVEYDAASYDNAVFWGDAEYELRCDGNTRLIVDDATPEQAVNATVGPKITEDTSDGWHSFKDLYHHRALLFSVIVHNYRDMCWKSKKHDDGTELDWNFIVGIDTPWGQASYHYGMEYWDMFDCKVLERAPKYDGYTPEQSVERIARLVELDAATMGAGTCKRIYHPNRITKTCTCSNCGYGASDKRWAYCPKCGHKYVHGEVEKWWESARRKVSE